MDPMANEVRCQDCQRVVSEVPDTLPPYVVEAQRALEACWRAYVADRFELTLRLRRCGLTLEQIARLLGVSREHVRHTEKRALDGKAKDA